MFCFLVMLRENFYWVSKKIRNCIVLAFLRYVLGPENSRYSQPIKCKTNSQMNLGHSRFPALFTYIYIEFWSAPCGIHLSVDWLLWLRILLFRFTTHTQSRCLLRSFFFKQKKNHFWNKHFPRNYQFKTTSVQDARIWRHAWLLTPRIVNNKRKFRITYVQHNGGKRNRETVWFSWRWHNLWIGYPIFILWGI